jgi:hypothetical protein
MDWAMEEKFSPLFLANEALESFGEHEVYDENSAIEALRMEIEEEYERASVLSEIPSKPLF